MKPNYRDFYQDNFEDASTASNLKSHGISLVPYSSATNAFTLDAPIAGVRKTLVMNAGVIADSTAINTSIYTGSTAILIQDNSTTVAPKLYVNILPPYANVELLGLSTSEWGIVSSYGAVQFTTAAGYTT